MISLVFRIVLILCSVFTFTYMVQKIRGAKLQIEHAIFWIMFAFLLIVISVFPELAICDNSCDIFLTIWGTPFYATYFKHTVAYLYTKKPDSFRCPTPFTHHSSSSLILFFADHDKLHLQPNHSTKIINFTIYGHFLIAYLISGLVIIMPISTPILIPLGNV